MSGRRRRVSLGSQYGSALFPDSTWDRREAVGRPWRGCEAPE
jgi:hypothetical protein